MPLIYYLQTAHDHRETKEIQETGPQKKRESEVKGDETISG